MFTLLGCNSALSKLLLIFRINFAKNRIWTGRYVFFELKDNLTDSTLLNTREAGDIVHHKLYIVHLKKFPAVILETNLFTFYKFAAVWKMKLEPFSMLVMFKLREFCLILIMIIKLLQLEEKKH